MANIEKIKVPDIGDFEDVEIIEILVKEGESIEKDVSLITLESDKASMEIPSPKAGVVKNIAVKLGDKVSRGDVILDIEVIDNRKTNNKKEEYKEKVTEQTSDSTIIVKEEEIKVPDIGDFEDVEIIEVLVNEGDSIEKDASLITLESDKASMEIPSPKAGVVKSIAVKLGEKVSQGHSILQLITSDKSQNINSKQEVEKPNTVDELIDNKGIETLVKKEGKAQIITNTNAHASPSIRRLARELGVDLSLITASGKKGRVLEKDLKQFVKKIINQSQEDVNRGPAIPPIPNIDFSEFGVIKSEPLSRINKLSGKHLATCWLNIPHVTQFDEADIDELEVFRTKQKAKGIKLTPLVFIMKAVVQMLKKYPRFNSSLGKNDDLILKNYYHIGIAVDTAQGLVVVVIRDVDKKSITELATELAVTSKRAREGKLTKKDLTGGSITISSLGGIGGTQFTPIVNAPEVAILGVAKSRVKPVWDGKKFIPKTMLPLALSYDHRVIDGAQGARFVTDLSNALSDIREILL